MGTKRIRTAGAERLSALEAATQLMAEQAKYEKWLDDLEAKKDATPPKVFDRVRQDYLTRLQSVMEQLGQHTAVLEEHAENLAAKLRELEEAEESNTEEQAEAALRKQVGEMSVAEWESGSRKAQRELSKIQENQAVTSEELNRIRDLLGDEGDEEEGEEEERKGSKDFNELEFLTKVVGVAPPQAAGAAPPARVSAPTPQRATPSAAAPAASAAAPAARVSAPSPQRPTPSAAQHAPAAAQHAPAAAPGAAAPPASPAPPPAPAAPRATPAASPTPAAAAAPIAAPATPVAEKPPTPPAAPSSGAPVKGRQTEAISVLSNSEVADQPKTLRCTECSAMNYPSEWYCERCGAELTVV